MRICDFCRKDMPYEKPNPLWEIKQNKVIMYAQGRNNPMDICPECQNKIWVYARKTFMKEGEEK